MAGRLLEKQSGFRGLRRVSAEGGTIQSELSSDDDDKDILPPLPYLTSSISEDDEEEDVGGAGYERTVDSGGWGRTSRGFSPVSDQEYAKVVEVDSYLQRYETMLRHQYAEDLATIDHLVPLLLEIDKIASGETTAQNDFAKEFSTTDFDVLREVSFGDIKSVLCKIDEQSEGEESLVSTDKQLMLVLRTVVDDLAEFEGREEYEDVAHQMITWGEIVQCYKICIASMQTLEKIPFPKNIRTRVRDRSLSMLSLFRASRELDTLKSRSNSISLATGIVVDNSTSTTRSETTSVKRSKKNLWIFIGLLFLSCIFFLAPSFIGKSRPAACAVHTTSRAVLPVSTPANSSRMVATTPYVTPRLYLSRPMLRVRPIKIYKDPMNLRRSQFQSNRNIVNIAVFPKANTSMNLGSSPRYDEMPTKQIDSGRADNSRIGKGHALNAALVSIIVGGSVGGLLFTNIGLLSAAVGPGIAPVIALKVTVFVTAITSSSLIGQRGWLRRFMSWLRKGS